MSPQKTVSFVPKAQGNTLNSNKTLLISQAFTVTHWNYIYDMSKQTSEQLAVNRLKKVHDQQS